MSTVQVNFVTDTEEYTMIFGDSYKTWRQQLQEYIWQLNAHSTAFTIHEMYLSHSRFRQDGLKWCTVEEYALELAEEGRDLNKMNWHQIKLPKVIQL